MMMQQDDESIPGEHLQGILQLVKTGQVAGLAPENILDDEELAEFKAHQAYLEPDLSSHFDNLAKVLPRNYLNRLALDVDTWVTNDEKTRQKWLDREAEGIKLLGVTNEPLFEPAFEGASQITHPLLAEAVTEFHARCIGELFPPEGPVKTGVLGEITPELEQQAERVQDWMNYQYTEDMPDAFGIEDKLLFRLPLAGSMFKKFFYDPLLKKVVCALIEPADFIVPYSATDLVTTTRYTHRYRRSHNWVLRNVKAGYFLETDYSEAGLDTNMDKPVLLDVIDDVEGKEVGSPEDTEEHTILEMVVYLDIPGYEDVDDMGIPTGIELPYKVWVDRDNRKVMRVERAYDQGDGDTKKLVTIVHKKFSPGFGFYGLGLLHLIGGLGRAATGFLNALMDSAAFYNMQGGYRSRNCRIPGGNDGPLAPGEWREVDCDPEELRSAFFHVPYKEPSQVLFNLLGLLDEKSQGFIGGDVMVGDANPNAPVGTTLALIEQGQKKFSAINRRLHVANRDEFRILAKLNSFYVPIQGYPYTVPGGDRMIYPYDFDDKVDILPVSDPDVISGSQRIVQGQAVLDLAEKFPEIVNKREAVKNMLRAMRVPDVDKLVEEDSQGAQMQLELQQLEIQIKQAELDKIKAEKVEVTIRGLFSAIQAAAVIAQTPGITPIADSIFTSAGGVDQDAAPLIAQGTGLLSENDTTITNLPANTNPSNPMPPNQGEPNEMLPQTPEPQSAAVGVNKGIETLRNEGIGV